MCLEDVILFCMAVIGFTHILVDPATIAQPFRNFVKSNCPAWLDKLFSCYQCCGTWVGFICGWFLVGSDPWRIFICGMAGSFLATWGATYLNYLEARSIISIDDGES